MTNISRRVMLGATGGLIAGGLLKTRANALTVEDEATRLQTVQADPTKVLGAPTSLLGQRAPEEQLQRGMGRPATASVSRTPIEQLQGIITPADLHFERHHAGVPAIDPNEYELLIHGMVDRPMTFTLDDLKRFPAGISALFRGMLRQRWRHLPERRSGTCPRPDRRPAQHE